MSYSNTFPTLKSKDILLYLKQLEISITLPELKEPTMKVMKGVYEKFVDLLMAVSKEELRQPQFGAIDVLQYPELHEESIGELGFTKAFLKLVRTVGLFDVSCRDFVYPKYQTTRHILSGLINFTKFRVDRMKIYQAFTTQTEQLLELKRTLDQKKISLNENVKQLQEAREKELPTIRALEEETNQLFVQITELHKYHAAVREKIKQGKNEKNRVEASIDNDTFLILNQQQVVEKLRPQVVRSPERLKKEISGMEKQSEVEKVEVDELMAQLRNLQAKEQMMNKVHNKLVKRTAEMNDTLAEVEKAKQMHKDIKEHSAGIRENNDQIQEHEALEAHLKRQIGNASDKLFRLQGEYEQQKSVNQTALNEVNSEKRSLEHAVAQDQQQIDYNARLLQRRQQELGVLQQEHQEDMANLRTKYDNIANQITSFHETLRAEMKMQS